MPFVGWATDWTTDGLTDWLTDWTLIVLELVMSFQMMQINFIWIFVWNIYERSLDHSQLNRTKEFDN